MTARKQFPNRTATVAVEGEFELNVFDEDDSVDIWLDRTSAPKDGLIIGTGKTAATAMSDARKSLLRMLAETECWEPTQ